MLELKIGHRGAGKEAPENTLLSFDEAIKCKCQDPYKTKGKVFI